MIPTIRRTRRTGRRTESSSEEMLCGLAVLAAATPEVVEAGMMVVRPMLSETGLGALVPVAVPTGVLVDGTLRVGATSGGDVDTLAIVVLARACEAVLVAAADGAEEVSPP